MINVLFFISAPHNFTGSQKVLAAIAAKLPPGLRAQAVFTSEGKAVDEFRRLGIPSLVIGAPPRLRVFQKRLLGRSKVVQTSVFLRDLIPYTFKLWRFILHSGADLVHCDSSRGVLVVGWAAKLAQKPLIWHLQGENILANHSHLNRVAAGLSTVVVSVAECLQKGLPESVPTQNIYNGLDAPRLTRSEDIRRESDEVLRRHGFSPDTSIRILTASSLVPFKGLHHLVDALQQLVQERPELASRLVWFILAGDDTEEERRYREHLRLRLEDAGLERNAIWLGWQNSASTWMEMADLVVLPTVQREFFRYLGEEPIELTCTEGLPLTILEAMHAGRPVVASNVAGVGEAVVEGETGFVVTPGSPDELRRAIAALIDAPELRCRMGDAASRRALQFTSDRMVSEFSLLYERLAGNRAERAAPH